jgi:hypothetical protein
MGMSIRNGLKADCTRTTGKTSLLLKAPAYEEAGRNPVERNSFRWT